MSYYDYKITRQGFRELLTWWDKTARIGVLLLDLFDDPKIEKDLRKDWWKDVAKLEEGSSIEMSEHESKSRRPETFSLDREDPRYFTKTLIEEEEE
jgi:hypothetical protein